MTKKSIKLIDVKFIGRMEQIKTHHSNLAGLSKYERKVLSYEAY